MPTLYQRDRLWLRSGIRFRHPRSSGFISVWRCHTVAVKKEDLTLFQLSVLDRIGEIEIQGAVRRECQKPSARGPSGPGEDGHAGPPGHPLGNTHPPPTNTTSRTPPTSHTAPPGPDCKPETTRPRHQADMGNGYRNRARPSTWRGLQTRPSPAVEPASRHAATGKADSEASPLPPVAPAFRRLPTPADGHAAWPALQLSPDARDTKHRASSHATAHAEPDPAAGNAPWHVVLLSTGSH